jgi:sugar phosphate isomerase/epimerase
MSVITDRRALLKGFAMTGMLASAGASAAPSKTFFERVKLPIGLQLYTLGEEPSRDLPGTLAKLAAIGYRDLQLPSLLGKTPIALRKAADDAGLKFSSIHLAPAGLGSPNTFGLGSPPAQIADTLGILGVKQAAMPIMIFPPDFRPKPGETFQAAIGRSVSAAGADLWKRTAALLNERASQLKPLGISLGYHNHNMEFAPIGSTNGWEILARETDPRLVSFEVDVGWVVAAGLDPVAFMRRYSGRVRQLHVKDVKPSTQTNYALLMDPTEVGSGKIDWARVLPAAYRAGCRNFYVEQEAPFAMPRIEAARKSFDYLVKLKA